MLTEHGRYRDSPMPLRRRLVWPEDARLAFWVVVNHEVYELDPPGGQGRVPWPRTQPDILGYSHRDYGNRIGMRRVIELLDRCGLRGALSVNVAALAHFPEIAAACVERNWEVLSHGVYNTRYLLGLTEDEERAVVEDCRATIEAHWGRPPQGWMGPSLTATEHTFDLLAECGFSYTLDLFHDDQPGPVHVRTGRLISVPYTVEANDILVYAHGTPADFGRVIRDQFDVLYEEGGRVMCVALHPFLVGQPHRVGALEEALRYVLSHDGVWATTGAEIADWYYEHHYDGDLQAPGPA